MASGAEEAPEQSTSATTATNSQLQWAGLSEAAADDPCTICLGEIIDAAHTDGCLHTFCFRCIQRWAASRAACPLCRTPFGRILHTVRVGDNYQEYVVCFSPCHQRTAARERVRSRSPQWRYHLRPRPTNEEPMAGRRGPVERRHRAQGDAALGPSNASARRAAGERPARPSGGLVLHNAMQALRARLIAFMGIE
ncbi:unnamed protein product [Bubo scandiacus]